MTDPRPGRVETTLLALAVLASVTLLPIAPARSATMTCAGVPATIVGTPGADVIEGTARADVIVGLGGNDRIRGGGGDDIICGGPGRDSLSGGAGADVLRGGAGRDRLSGNVGTDVLIGAGGPDLLRGGAGIDRLIGGSGQDYCSTGEVVRACEKGPSAPSEPRVELVIHVSIDGLRPDAITPETMPNLHALSERGASTGNARTDPDVTRTLPNHTSQLTGVLVNGPFGHGVTYNEDQGRTVHDEAGRDVASVFDVVHDHGGRTGAWVGKQKFDVIDRSWDSSHGAPDRTGADDGRDKIDVFVRADPLDAVEDFVEVLGGERPTYAFVHVRSPDEFGHDAGWDTPGYADGLAEADFVMQRIISTIETMPELSGSTAIIVTSDHGGPTGSTNHGDADLAANYTIPFIVWAPGVAAGGDLYQLNAGVRLDPVEGRPGADGLQPIRGHDAGNLALDLLGFPSIPGSVFNADHSLRIN